MKSEPIAFLGLVQLALQGVLQVVPLPAPWGIVVTCVTAALSAMVGRQLVTPTAKLPK